MYACVDYICPLAGGDGICSRGEFVVGARHTGLSVILSSAALLQLFTQLKLCCVVHVLCGTHQSCVLNGLHLETGWRTLVYIGIEVSRQ